MDHVLEDLAHDVGLLRTLGLLQAEAFRCPNRLRSLRDAEEAAGATRAALDSAEEPLWDIARASEALGLFSFALNLRDGEVDGAYVSLDGCGVTVINGRHDSGRRRFTLAHEIGHHVLQDEYSTEWDVMAGLDERERLLNAFAIHLLVPRSALKTNWRALEGAQHPRRAAMKLGINFGVSWTAVCAHLKNVDLIDGIIHQQLVARPPARADYVEEELSIREDLRAPSVPPRYGAAVVRAFRTQRIGPKRAVELLHGTLAESDLPPLDSVPIDSLRKELEPVRGR